MKKTIIYSFIILLLGMMSCSPIDNKEELTGSITADLIDATVNVEQILGKNVNKVTFECHSSINCQWTNGVKTVTGACGEMVMFAIGEQKVTLTGRCGDGSIITKEFPVTVDEMHYPVEPEYGYLCGDGEKTWVWDDELEAPLGNGGYLVHTLPEWWKITFNDMEQQCIDNKIPVEEGRNGSMTFVLNGMKLIKSGGSEGTFTFDMEKRVQINGEDWIIGKLYTKDVEVLMGALSPTTEYDIYIINDEKLYLGYAAPGTGQWGGCFFWCFRAKNS